MPPSKEELDDRLAWFRSQSKLLERATHAHDLRPGDAQRKSGRAPGVENYSAPHRRARSRPTPPLLDYFPDDFLLIIDESHVTILDQRCSRAICRIAHPSTTGSLPLRDGQPSTQIKDLHPAHRPDTSPRPPALRAQAATGVVGQIIRPTGLVDPLVVVKPTEGQIDDHLEQGCACARRTRRARPRHHPHQEDGRGTDHLPGRARRQDRIPALRRRHTAPRSSCYAVRLGTFDVLVGINLLREGLDLPEVSSCPSSTQTGEGFCALSSDHWPRRETCRRGPHVRRQHDGGLSERSHLRDIVAADPDRLQQGTASTRGPCARKSPTSPICSPRTGRHSRPCSRAEGTAGEERTTAVPLRAHPPSQRNPGQRARQNSPGSSKNSLPRY